MGCVSTRARLPCTRRTTADVGDPVRRLRRHSEVARPALSRTWVVSIIFVSPIKRDQGVNVNPRAVSPLSTDAGRQARLNELVSDISARLRSACVSLSEAEFNALIRQIAETTLKYEVREEGGNG
jgi:hypothetical protein